MPDPIAITCGDPAGVGPEIVAHWWREHCPGASDYCLIGPACWLKRFPGECLKYAVGDPAFELSPGEPSERGAQVALSALEEAAEGCRQGRYRAVVTLPVSKHELVKVGYVYPGQTEFFAARWGGEPTMAFAGERLRVVLATWHIPLMEVAARLNTACLERAVERADLLARQLGSPQPRIAVCGLNPHAGETGLMGGEESELIDPVLDNLRERFCGLSRALPADTVFWRQLQGEFDVVVALYHDQGLAPLKTLEFERAVNITLGLPWVRTSPDHGTAFTLAGKGKADTRSFEAAVDLARKLSSTAQEKH